MTGPSIPKHVRAWLDEHYDRIERIEEYVLMYTAGESLNAIAKRFNTIPQIVGAHLKRAGLKLRPRGKPIRSKQ